MKRKTVLPLLLIIFMVSVITLAICGLRYDGSPRSGGDGRTITDMDDNNIEVPEDPRRIACMHGVSSERIIILGGGGRLVLSMKPSPWMLRLFPEVKNSQAIEGPFTGNVERMLKLKVDLVLYSPYPGEAEKYRAAGIRTACGFSPKKRPRTLEEYSANFRRQVIFIGDILGPEAQQRAKRYCAYFDNTVNRILARTSKIKPGARPHVYYGGRGGAPLLSQGRASVMHWNTLVAGGNFLPASMDNNFTEVNMEQIYAWDPDIILLSGWCQSTGIIRNNPAWSSLRAVRNRKVCLIPEGVFTWDHASCESVLLMIYMAKIFHPELFKDWDMIEEMKKFYGEIYGRKITDRDAERILKHLGPM